MKRIAVFITVFASACSGGDPSGAPTTSIATVTTDSGAATVRVLGPSDPLSRGASSLVFDISNTASGVPIDGLAISITPWMPSMSHGASTLPTVTARGGGLYDVSGVVLVMPGAWQLRTHLAGTLDDTTAITVAVE